jgi:predicted dehydrogenase
MKNVLKVVIAGYGILGKVRHNTIKKLTCFDVVAISDILIDSFNIDKNIKKYHDYVSMIEDKNLDYDIVFVCLTNNSNPDATMRALNNNAHVFCEKPPGLSVQDIVNVIEVEKQHPKLKLMYGFNHRYHESVQEAICIIKSNKLGKIINIRGVYGKSQLITFSQPDWRTKREIAGGGVLLDQGIHMVDLMRLFAGEFTEIHSFVENSYWNYDVEDNAYAIMRTKDGVVAMMNSSATQWRHRFHLDINFEKGSLILGGILSGSKSYGAETLTIVSSSPKNDCGDPKETTIRYNTDPSWYAEIKEFSDCVINDKKITTGTSNDALQTMKLVYKIYYADEKWRQIYNIKNPEHY